MSAINPSQIQKPKKSREEMIVVPASSLKKSYGFRRLAGDTVVPMTRDEWWRAQHAALNGGSPTTSWIEQLDRTQVGRLSVQTNFIPRYELGKVVHPFEVSLYDMKAFEVDTRTVSEDRALTAMPIQVGCLTREHARHMHSQLVQIAGGMLQ